MTDKKGSGAALDADTKEFLFNMEKTAKNILKEHNKKKLLDAAKAKADAVRRRAWEEANARGTASGNMLLEGSIRPETVAALTKQRTSTLSASGGSSSTSSLPPLGASGTLGASAPFGYTGGGQSSTLRTTALGSTMVGGGTMTGSFGLTGTMGTPGGDAALPHLGRSQSAEIKKAKSMRAVSELTRNPLATSTCTPPVCCHPSIIPCLCIAMG
jgi:hypothetical protein